MKPMLAYIGDISILNNEDFIFEPKLDGYRALCYKNKSLKFLSRNDLSLTEDFPELKIYKNIKAKSAIIDGEIVIYNEKGRPDFQLIQNSGQRKGKKYPATYVVFDILEKDGKDLTKLPLIKRKEILIATVEENEFIQINPFTNDGKRLWKEIKKMQLEGVMAKRKTSHYLQSRNRDWIKVKITDTIDAIVIGYESGKRAISSLALGVYDRNKKIIYIGKVGTGFNSKMIEELKSKLEKIKIKDNKPIAKTNERNIIWVKPKLVAEIKYHEMTQDKILRAPVFLRLREDKTPEECMI